MRMAAIIIRKLDERSVKKSWDFVFVKLGIRIWGHNVECKMSNARMSNAKIPKRPNVEKTKL